MSIESTNNPNAGGGSNRLQIIPAILTLILIASSTIMGCNGHSDPVSTDPSSTTMRLAQDFGTPTPWPDEEFDFDWLQWDKIECVPEDWRTSEPFTGPSVCMRDSSNSGWEYDKFAIAYIVEDFNSYIAVDDTHQ